MKLHHIRDVLAVAKFGSLRAAARHVGVVQPAITRSIQDIERELGAALFERHSQGVRLTPIGEAFVKRASIIESELRRVREEVDQLKGLSTGNVTVALSLASTIALFPGTLTQFYKRFPDAKVRTLETLFPPIESDLLDGKVDVYIGALDDLTPISPRLVMEELFDNHRVIVARKDHPLMQATSIAELNNARWAFGGLASPGFETDFEEWFSRVGLEQPKTVLHTRSALQTMLAVSSSDLLTMAPRQWLELPILAERIHALPIVPTTGSPPICLVRQRGVPLTPMAEFFCDVVRRIARAYIKRSAPLNLEPVAAK